jgi:hypothetical protein
MSVDCVCNKRRIVRCYVIVRQKEGFGESSEGF